MQERDNISEKARFIVFDDSGGVVGAKIKIIGVGGAGGNAVNQMIEAGISGAEFIAANTDRQALERSLAPVKIQLGTALTRGLGAGGDPEMGRRAALDDTDIIAEVLQDADMVFVAAGLGGGTGTGAAPIVGSLASELGALTVAVVTKPFTFEGQRRGRNALAAHQELEHCVDSVITIPNDRIVATVGKETPFLHAFRIADDVLRQAVAGVTEIVNVPGIINVDFADVRAVMHSQGLALMGIGEASGEDRARRAVELAISSPLLNETSIKGASGMLVNIRGGGDITLAEINEAMMQIHDCADTDANIIFGAVIDETLTEKFRVTVIATGFPKAAAPGAERLVGAVAAGGGALQHDVRVRVSPERTPAFLRRAAD